MDTKEIEARLDAIEHLFNDRMLKSELREYLEEVRDLERLLARSIHGSANARDLAAIRTTMESVPVLIKALDGKVTKAISQIRNNMDPCYNMTTEIYNAIVDEPPVGIRDGGMIREGYDSQLDELRDMSASGGKWMANLEESERKTTGIKNLKIKYNRVFGYFIEVGIAHLDKVPDEYTQKQTLANCGRFITQELKEKESQILSVQADLILYI